MICPYCDKEMSLGKIMAIRRIIWSEADNRNWALYEKEGEITLADGLNVAKVNSYRCHNCKKIIIDEIEK